MRVSIDREGMTVDLVVWKALGRQDERLVERTLALNPGLAGLGPILPVGTQLELPDISAKPEAIETTRLWS